MSNKSGVARQAETPVERDWIQAARELLIEGGIAAVEVKPLAERLGVTRGGFYWRFANRQDLLNQLIDDWEASNARTFLEVLARPGTPQDRYARLINLWIEETDFNPGLEAAIRQWGAMDADVKNRVLAVDLQRIAAIADIFLQDGRDPTEADVRARIIYFHQVGYYALDLGETREERTSRIATYTRLLAGFSDD